MKKSIFLCIVLGTLTMNAQVTLIGTVKGSPASTSVSPAYADWGVPVQYYYSTSFDSQSKELIIIFNDAETLQQYKVVTINNFDRDGWIVCATKNFWTTDGKMSFLLVKEAEHNPGPQPADIAPRKIATEGPREMSYYITDEDGNILQTLVKGDDYGIIKTESGYMLFIGNYGDFYSVYSIPGNGLVTE